jgi:hypothetical protein
VRVRLHLPEGDCVTVAPAMTVAEEPFREAVEAAFGAGSVTVK